MRERGASFRVFERRYFEGVPGGFSIREGAAEIFLEEGFFGCCFVAERRMARGESFPCLFSESLELERFEVGAER